MRPAQEFDSYLRSLPAAEDCERFAISSALRFDNRLREYMGMLNVEHFSSERNRTIWKTMQNLYDADGPVNFQTLLVEVGKSPGGVESAGGVGYLSDLSDSAPDVKAEIWAKPILETYARRRLMLKCNEAMMRLGSLGESPAAISQELEEESRFCAAVGEPSTGFASFADTVREAGGMDAFLSRSAADALPYPWENLNLLTNGGMRPGHVVVVAGPSGLGKTALALNMAYSAGTSGRGVPLIFSLEMDKKEINTRLLALAAKVDSYHFHRPDPGERERLSRGRQILVENEILVDDDDCVSIPAMAAKVKKVAAVQPVSMVMIDYIQLIEGKKSMNEIREQEISRIMRGIKRMATKLKVPVVALSQILEDAGAGSREPELKDLRESRSIGHTANLVGFLYFTQRYDIGAGITTGELDFIVRKQRGGPEGRIKLRFHAPTGHFYEAM